MPTTTVARSSEGHAAWRVLRFGLVGLSATGVHFVVALMALRGLAVPPALANALGFSVALTVSFIGHASYTFRASATVAAASRFLAVSLATVTLGSGLVAWLAHHTPWPGVWVLAIGALFSAGANFIGHSLWSFGHRHR
ncbi:MAG: GtrA family protein [Proteobacteria bacterium]|nr:GtrA family protein [Pseudomonadota bacterium]